MLATEDKAIVSRLQDTVAKITNILDLDDQFPATLDNDDNSDSSKYVHVYSHTSLKAACPTRWHSTLEMMESIIDLKREVQNALKRIGRADLTLQEDKLDFITELVTFLKPFPALTDLVSLSAPTLVNCTAHQDACKKDLYCSCY